jgi:FkbM family methyltransferase
MKINFINDYNVSIELPDHKFSKLMKTRPSKEPLFRKINSYLIKFNFINGNIIDLGAWIGDNSIPWAMNFNNKKIYAIDPSEENINYIKSACLLNNIENIITINEAISDKNEVLYTTNVDIDHCSFVYHESDSTNKIEVFSTTLSELYLSKMIYNIGYIHLDAEGMEHRILKGADELFYHNGYPLITFEQHCDIDDVKSIVELLTSMNYRIFVINEVLEGCRHDCRNFIATPNTMNTTHAYIKMHFGDNSITEINLDNCKNIL